MTLYNYYENEYDWRKGNKVEPNFHYSSSGTPDRLDIAGLNTRRDSWYPGADGGFGPQSLPLAIEGYIPDMPMRNDSVGAKWQRNYSGEDRPYQVIQTSPIGALSTSDTKSIWIIVGFIAALFILPKMFKKLS
jgi:hypothetical protein